MTGIRVEARVWTGGDKSLVRTSGLLCRKEGLEVWSRFIASWYIRMKVCFSISASDPSEEDRRG